MRSGIDIPIPTYYDARTHTHEECAHAAHDDDVDAFTQLVAYATPLAAARRTQRLIFTRRSRPELPPRMIF